MDSPILQGSFALPYLSGIVVLCVLCFSCTSFGLVAVAGCALTFASLAASVAFDGTVSWHDVFIAALCGIAIPLAGWGAGALLDSTVDDTEEPSPIRSLLVVGAVATFFSGDFAPALVGGIATALRQPAGGVSDLFILLHVLSVATVIAVAVASGALLLRVVLELPSAWLRETHPARPLLLASALRPLAVLLVVALCGRVAADYYWDYLTPLALLRAE